VNTISLAETKAHVSALIDRVDAGETVAITRRGKEVARISPRAMRDLGSTPTNFAR